MKQKYIFDKQKAKLNQWQLIDVKNEDSKMDNNLYCYWLGNEYPSFSMIYDEEKDCIREKTKYEKYIWKEYELQDGEYIEDKEIKYKEKPKQDERFWYWKDSEWQFDFIEWKKSLEQELFSIRDTAFYKDINYNNFIFRMLPIDIENFKERALQVALGSVKLEDETQWRLKNDTVQVFKIKEILEILTLWGKRKIQIFETFNKLYEKFLMEIEEDKLREFMFNVKSEFLE
nr:MAG TPA: hypothetical protein [Ackermannviridae sp.]